MSIATKTGDSGITSLIGGRRVSKADLRVDAYGIVDELISQLGLARALSGHQEAQALAKTLQRELFSIAEAIASDARHAVEQRLIDGLTDHVHRLEGQAGILLDWAIPGDHAGAAAFDVARTTCRRAERAAVRLRDRGDEVDASVIIYLNRLADLLWLLGRMVERDAGINAAMREPGSGGGPWSKAWP